MVIYDFIADPQIKNKHVLEMLLLHHIPLSSKDELIRSYDMHIKPEIYDQVLADYKKYTDENQPLEYILGSVTFFDRSFLVNQDTLIPRPETEYMIQAVSEYISSKTNSQILVDVGTGCGVLGLSVFLEHLEAFEKVICTEYFAPTLGVAKENMRRLVPTSKQNKCQFVLSDLLEYFLDPHNISLLAGTQEIYVVSNLPYIPDDTFDTQVEESAKKREPRQAFLGGQNGCDLYKILIQQIHTLITKHHLPISQCFFEMMTWQVDILRQTFKEYFTFEEVKTFHQNIRIVRMSGM